MSKILSELALKLFQQKLERINQQKKELQPTNSIPINEILPIDQKTVQKQKEFEFNAEPLTSNCTVENREICQQLSPSLQKIIQHKVLEKAQEIQNQKDLGEKKTAFQNTPLDHQKQSIPSSSINTQDNIIGNTPEVIAKEHITKDFQVLTPKINVQNKNLKIFTQEELSKLPKLYFMNNLLSLSHVLCRQRLKVEMKRLSIKHNISFNRILVAFCIQKLVQLFYQDHDVQLQVKQSYIFSRIGGYLHRMFEKVHINNWFILRRIMRGVLNRFGALDLYHDAWLEGCLIKKKSLLQSNGIDVNKMMTYRHYFVKNNGQVGPKFIDEDPKQLNFKNYHDQYPQLKLEDQSQQEMHDPEQKHAKNKLKYFTKRINQKREHERIVRQQAKQARNKVPSQKMFIDIKENQQKYLQIGIFMSPSNLPQSLDENLLTNYEQYQRQLNARREEKSLQMPMSKDQIIRQKAKLKKQYQQKINQLTNMQKKQKISSRKTVACKKSYTKKVTDRKTISHESDTVQILSDSGQEFSSRVSQTKQKNTARKKIKKSSTPSETSPQNRKVAIRPKSAKKSTKQPDKVKTTKAQKNQVSQIKNYLPTSKKLQKVQEEYIINKMQKKLIKYTENNSDFSIEELVQEIVKVLHSMKMPEDQIIRISYEWLQKYGLQK